MIYHIYVDIFTVTTHQKIAIFIQNFIDSQINKKKPHDSLKTTIPHTI